MTRLRLLAAALAAVLGTAIGLALPLPTSVGAASSPTVSPTPRKACACPGATSSTAPFAGPARQRV